MSEIVMNSYVSSSTQFQIAQERETLFRKERLKMRNELHITREEDIYFFRIIIRHLSCSLICFSNDNLPRVAEEH